MLTPAQLICNSNYHFVGNITVTGLCFLLIQRGHVDNLVLWQVANILILIVNRQHLHYTAFYLCGLQSAPKFYASHSLNHTHTQKTMVAELPCKALAAGPAIGSSLRFSASPRHTLARGQEKPEVDPPTL